MNDDLRRQCDQGVKLCKGFKAETGGFEESALEQWFQSHDRYESESNCFPLLLEQCSNRLGCER
jgi:hypothetical protein